MVTPEMVQERSAAIADDAAAASEQEAAQAALTAAQAQVVASDTRRAQTQARRKAADDAIVALLKDGETRLVHPTDMPLLVRVGDTIKDGTIYTIHGPGNPAEQ